MSTHTYFVLDVFNKQHLVTTSANIWAFSELVIAAYRPSPTFVLRLSKDDIVNISALHDSTEQPLRFYLKVHQDSVGLLAESGFGEGIDVVGQHEILHLRRLEKLHFAASNINDSRFCARAIVAQYLARCPSHDTGPGRRACANLRRQNQFFWTNLDTSTRTLLCKLNAAGLLGADDDARRTSYETLKLAWGYAQNHTLLSAHAPPLPPLVNPFHVCVRASWHVPPPAASSCERA